jgi:hypothetical protein
LGGPAPCFEDAKNQPDEEGAFLREKRAKRLVYKTVI